MSDETKNTMSQLYMTTKNRKEVKKTESEDADDQDTSDEDEDTGTDDEETDESDESEDADDTTDESADDESEDDEDESGEESEDEDDGSSTDEDELDLDAELDRENRLKQPDKKKAKDAFKDRDKKRKEVPTGGISEERLQEILAADRKERQQDDALRFAKEMAGSDKEAQLIVAKWSNRTFPKGLTLREQIQESYAITHSKKLIGERNEAMRGLKGKQTVKKTIGSSHQDAQRNKNEPALPPGELAVIRQSGFEFNNKTRQYEKKLANGRILVRDMKTKQVRLLPKGTKR